MVKHTKEIVNEVTELKHALIKEFGPSMMDMGTNEAKIMQRVFRLYDKCKILEAMQTRATANEAKAE